MKKLALAVLVLLLMCGCGGTPQTALIIVGVHPSVPTDIDQGQTLQFQANLLASTPSVIHSGVTWTVTGPGCAAAACGTITSVTATSAVYVAPATVSAPLSITVKATSLDQPLQSSSATFNVMPPPSIVTTDLPPATPADIYHVALIATGGVQPLNWSLASGTLPDGMLLNSNGVLFGTPTTGSTTSFTVKVTDSSGSQAGSLTTQRTLSFTIIGILTADAGALPSGTVGTAYSTTLTATGGVPPYSWSIFSGSLPSGVSMQPGGVLAGTPTIAGTYTFQMHVVDSSPVQQNFTTSNYTITINPSGPLTIRTTGLIDATANTPYQAQLVATGGAPPLVWTVTAGGLPSGLALSPTTGIISGSPTAAPGSYPFTVQAADSGTPVQTASQSLSITVNAAAPACTSTGNSSVLLGQYAFSLRGYNSAGFVAVVGSFTADGTGSITAGEADANGVLGAQTGNLIVSGSSYSVGPDNRGCATLATPFGTFYTRFVLGGISAGIANQGRIIEFENPGPTAYIASGLLVRQNPVAFISGLSGGYDLQTSGWDPASSSRYACVGIVSGNANKFTSQEQDCNDNGTVTNTVNTTSSTTTHVNTYSAADTNGRGTGIFAVGQGTSSFTFYWVSTTQLFVVNSDPGPYFSGIWQQEKAPVGSAGFRQTHFNGKVAAYSSGLASSQASSDVLLATETADGATSVASQIHLNSAGVLQNSNSTCTYAVVANGRLTETGSNCGATPPIAYLNDINTAYNVGTASTVESGAFEPLTAGLAISSLAGTYYVGTSEIVSQQAQAEVAILTLASNGVLTTTTDTASTLSQSVGISGSDSMLLNSDNTFSTGSSGATIVGLAITPTRFVIIGAPTLTFPTLQIGQR